MIRAFKPTDRVKVKVKKDDGEIVFTIKPLKYSERTAINNLAIKVSQGEVSENASALVFETLRRAIVDVVGLNYYDGEEFKCEFESDVLTEECMEALMNTPTGSLLTVVGSKWYSSDIDLDADMLQPGVTLELVGKPKAAK